MVEEVGGLKSVNVGKTMDENVGGNRNATISKNFSETVKEEYSLKAKKIFIQADEEINLKTGSATISMKKSGDILISGKNVEVKGSGKISLKASSDLTLKGSKIKEN